MGKEWKNKSKEQKVRALKLQKRQRKAKLQKALSQVDRSKLNEKDKAIYDEAQQKLREW